MLRNRRKFWVDMKCMFSFISMNAQSAESSRDLNNGYRICCRCLDHRDCKRTLAIPRYLCRGRSVGAIWLRYVHWAGREPAPGAELAPRAARVALRPTHNQIHHKYGHFQRKFRGIDHAQTPFWTDTERGRPRDVATSHVSNPHFYFWRPSHPPSRPPRSPWRRRSQNSARQNIHDYNLYINFAGSYLKISWSSRPSLRRARDEVARRGEGKWGRGGERHVITAFPMIR